jgi:hypothetical protein
MSNGINVYNEAIKKIISRYKSNVLGLHPRICIGFAVAIANELQPLIL